MLDATPLLVKNIYIYIRRSTLDASVSITLKGITVKCVRWDLTVSHGCLEHQQLQISVKVHSN